MPTGNAIDVEGLHCYVATSCAPNQLCQSDGKLVLRHRRPISFPFPNAYSHPIPRFEYDPSTGHIQVRFACDPSYPPPSASPSLAWREKKYILTSVPLAKPRSFVEEAASFLTTIPSALTTPFTGTSAAGPSRNAEAREFDLRDDEVVEEERGESGEVDDSPENRRDVRVIALPITQWVDKGDFLGGSNTKSRERRRWEIVPILHQKARQPSSPRA